MTMTNPEAPLQELRPPLALGGAITGVVVFAVISWTVLGLYILHLPSYFAAFLLFWYWASIQKSDFRRLPAALIGALVGICVIWALRSLIGAFGTLGLVAGALLIILAILGEIMGWAPIALNPCTMLFLTVAGIPMLMQAANFLETMGALLVGTAYLGAIVWIAQKLAPKPPVAASSSPASTRVA